MLHVDFVYCNVAGGEHPISYVTLRFRKKVRQKAKGQREKDV